MRDKTNIKVTQITPSLAKGGIERVVTISSKELKRYYELSLIVMDDFRTDYLYEGKRFDLGISWENRKIIYRLYNFVLAIFRLKKLSKKEQFNVVIAHGELASFPSILAGLKNLIVVVHEDRFSAKKDLQGKLANRVLKYLFSKKDLEIVTVSKGVADSLIDNIGLDKKSISTIYNGYYIDEFINRSKEEVKDYKEIFYNNKVIIAVGRLINQKGHWYLLRIFSQLKDRKNTKLIILGEGNLQDKLITLSERLGLKTFSKFRDDNFHKDYDVYFLGFQKNPFNYISNSTIFIMPSIWEGFGNTIVEAMACGTPVITANAPSGPAEIVAPKLENSNRTKEYPYTKEYGILMPPFENRYVDEKEPISATEKIWIDTVESILNDDKKREELIIRGIKRARDFDIRNLAEEWKSLIERVGKRDG